MHYAELRAVREELIGPGGQFEITKAEVLGNQLLVFKNAPPSVREVWLASAAFAAAPYLIYGDEVLTYAQSHVKNAPNCAALPGVGSRVVTVTTASGDAALVPKPFTARTRA